MQACQPKAVRSRQTSDLGLVELSCI
jgi:hypothetical protein